MAVDFEKLFDLLDYRNGYLTNVGASRSNSSNTIFNPNESV
jgi:chorismate mutase